MNQDYNMFLKGIRVMMQEVYDDLQSLEAIVNGLEEEIEDMKRGEKASLMLP